MEWQTVAAFAGPTIALILGLAAILRTRNSTTALNVATNIQSTYDTQASIIATVQADLKWVKKELKACEEAHASARRENFRLETQVQRLATRVKELEHDSGSGG